MDYYRGRDRIEDSERLGILTGTTVAFFLFSQDGFHPQAPRHYNPLLEGRELIEAFQEGGSSS